MLKGWLHEQVRFVQAAFFQALWLVAYLGTMPASLNCAPAHLVPCTVACKLVVCAASLALGYFVPIIIVRKLELSHLQRFAFAIASALT